jgi:hypothetical protein
MSLGGQIEQALGLNWFLQQGLDGFGVEGRLE